jgi:hypothetical protein
MIIPQGAPDDRISAMTRERADALIKESPANAGAEFREEPSSVITAHAVSIDVSSD